jgi:hypothetical protein
MALQANHLWRCSVDNPTVEITRNIIEEGNAILNEMAEEAARAPLSIARLLMYEQRMLVETGMTLCGFEEYTFARRKMDTMKGGKHGS